MWVLQQLLLLLMMVVVLLLMLFNTQAGQLTTGWGRHAARGQAWRAVLRAVAAALASAAVVVLGCKLCSDGWDDITKGNPELT